ncbi:MAG: DNA polymerase III subunit beta [Gemmataceae bacterium]
MKIVCHREGLLEACQLVSVAVAPRSVNEILHNIKMIVDEERCTLIATDEEVGISMTVGSVQEVENPGEVLLPSSRVLSILRETTDQVITIEADPDSCSIRGEKAEFEMMGQDPSIFMPVPSFEGDQYHQMSAGVLRNMIRRTNFAVSNQDQTKYAAMTGILWEFDGDMARLVATDGRRLALCEGPAAQHGSHSTQDKIPAVPDKAMTLLERNLQDPEEAVRVAIRTNDILIKTERATIHSRLVEGRFPNYSQVIPKNSGVRLPLDIPRFFAAVRQAAIMTDEESQAVTFAFGDGKLTLQARGAGAGRSKVELDLEYNDEPLEISFNPKYLVEMLRVVNEDEEMTLDLVDGRTAAVFRNADNNYTYVVVPLVPNAPKG